MKHISITFALTAMLSAPVPASADEMFTGDVKLACEAILCLSTGQRPNECEPSIQRYFSISMRKSRKTVQARKNFLNLCPASTQDQNMVALVDAIANGAGQCDHAALNSNLRILSRNEDGSSYISNALPSYCTAYSGNTSTDIKPPRYVGIPERGGFWADPANYEQVSRDYNERIAREGAQGYRESLGW